MGDQVNLEEPFMNRVVILVLTLLTAMAVLCGCGGGGGNNPIVPPNPIVAGNLDLPNDPSGNLVVIAGSENSIPGEDASFDIELQPNCTQAVMAVDDGKLQAVAIVLDTSSQSTVLLNPRSTAEAIVLLTPMVAQETITGNTGVMEVIKSLPELSQLETAIAHNLETYGTAVNPDSPDQGFIDALSNTLNALFENEQFRNASAWNINPNSASMLEIRENTETPATNDFEAVNSAKRYVDIYDGSALVAGVGSLGLATMYQPSHCDFTLDITGRSQITLKAYGAGIHNIPTEGEDLSRLAFPAVRSLLFDMFIPVVRIAIGSAKIGNLESLNDLLDIIFNDPMFIASVLNKIASGDYPSVALQLASKATDILLDDLAQKGFNSILIRCFGEELAACPFTWLLLPVKLVAALTQVGDLILSITAFASCSAVETFYLEIEGVDSGQGWARTWGGTESDEGEAVAIDSLGNVFVTGYFSGSTDLDPGPDIAICNATDVDTTYLSKFDANGNLLWVRTFGGAGETDTESSVELAIDSGGNIYVAGEFSGTVNFDPGPGAGQRTSNGDLDIFLAKFDTNGYIQWVQTWGGSATYYYMLADKSEGVAVDGSGNIFVSGWFKDAVDFDPGVGEEIRYSNGESDGFVSKFDPNGNFIWVLTCGSPEGANIWDIACDNSGNAYVVVEKCGVSYEVLKISPLGSQQWVVDLESTCYYSISINDLNEVFVAGESTLANLSQSGVLQWELNWTTDFCVLESRDVHTDFYGNIYLTGYYSGIVDFDPGNGIFESANDNGAFLLKLDSIGDLLWVRTWISNSEYSYYNMGSGIAIYDSQCIYVTGIFEGDTDFSPGSESDPRSSNGNCDAFLVKMLSNGYWE